VKFKDPTLSKSSDLKILLLQIRDKEQVRLEEFQSFVAFSGLHEQQLQVLNVFEKPVFSPQCVNDYDAVFVGGASEASVLEPDVYPFVPYCVELLKYCYEISKPVFASCFGFQLAVLAMGGKIVRDEKDFEIGTLPINLTAAAKNDPILGIAPDPFYAVSVHRERAPELPEHCELLAYTDQCPHAFKVEGKPFWAFQFHPEVDRRTLVTRLGIFQDQYTENAEHFQEVIENARETPESNALVKEFIRTLT
jgi:GMP synthase (glutamine-hydrolysing)